MLTRFNCAIVDVDGVLRREQLQLPGVPELFEAFVRRGIQSVILSNNSRVRSNGIVAMMEKFGVQNFNSHQAITSAEATVLWMQKHPSSDEPRVYAIGEDGVFSSLRDEGMEIVNHEWDGQMFQRTPTDVVCGFDTKVSYEKLAPAWNAIRQGARFIGTNPDLCYRNESGAELPANGAAIAYLETAGRQSIIIGKPHAGMAEVALDRFGLERKNASIAVIGDTLEQDAALAEELHRTGWNARSLIVLSGVVTEEEAATDPRVDEIFEDIREITEALLRS